MKDFVKIPNLPQGVVTDAIVSGDIAPKAEEALCRLGISLIKTVRHPCLYDAVAYHADMQLHHLGCERIICDPRVCEYYKETLPSSNICLGKRIGGVYPYDVAYNAARIGEYLICSSKHTDDEIMLKCRQEGVKIINVRQGYAKCNICIVDERSIITSDAGIAKALTDSNINVLFTDDRNVALKGLDHGFLGGATGKIAADKLVVNGNIKYHKNAAEIINFAKERDVEIISLTDGLIDDIGSILPIYEKISL